MAAVCAMKYTAASTASIPNLTSLGSCQVWVGAQTQCQQTQPCHNYFPSICTVCLQIRLPKSAGDALMSQDAPKNGAMLFQLATSAGRSVHAGVLDFSAAPGTVAIPEHLIRNLWGLTTCDGQCHGDVIVTYKKLPKGTSHHHCLLASQPNPCNPPDSISTMCQPLHASKTDPLPKMCTREGCGSIDSAWRLRQF